MPEPTLWISEQDVTAILSLPDAIGALSAAFAEEGAGSAHPLEKTLLSFGAHSTLHALGAASTELAGVKAWAHTPGGADPLLVLFDPSDGHLVAAVEAFALGQLRTAGTAALATDLLARDDSQHLGVIGTGKQALAQVAAVAAVRDIEEVRAYSRDPGRRAAFAARVTSELGLRCEAAASATEAVSGADVVTLVTRATAPVLTGDMVEPGLHINAVGAIALDRRELDPAVLGRAGLVVTDSASQARNFSSELREHFGGAAGGWQGLRTLGHLVAHGLGRSDPREITLFKGMGSGVEDLALGVEVVSRARKAGLGVEIGRRGRANPSLARAMSRKLG